MTERISVSTLFALRRGTAGVERGAPAQLLPGLLDAAGLPAYETEYCFWPGRRWRFDYAWPLFKIALEQEGGAHGRLIIIGAGIERRAGQSLNLKPGTKIRVGGRHQSGPGFEGDIEKYNRAAIAGWLVLRATTRQIRDGLALRDLRAAFAARGLE